MSPPPKRLVLDFLKLCFVQKQPRAAFDRFISPTLIQHNPGLADGAEPALTSVEQRLRENLQLHFDIRRTIAENDLVVVHALVKSDPKDRGRAVVDIFRVNEGKIVEHWDVVQLIPETSVSPHPLF